MISYLLLDHMLVVVGWEQKYAPITWRPPEANDVGLESKLWTLQSGNAI